MVFVGANAMERLQKNDHQDFMLSYFHVLQEWNERAALPNHVITMLNNFPSNLHPMSQFSAAITALNSESKFAKAYADGIHKSKLWEVQNIQNIYYHVTFLFWVLRGEIFCVFLLFVGFVLFRHCFVCLFDLLENMCI